MSGRAVHWLDVFTDVPFAGNPLAVLPDADGLGDEEMRTIAHELGLSETVFVFGGAERLRIFTPAGELPLAGHPVVGATIDLARMGRIAADGEHVFATGAGSTPVEVRDGVATMTQAPFEVLREVDPCEVAGALRVEAGAFVSAPRLCTTTGVRQLLAGVRDRETLATLDPDLAAVSAIKDTDGLAAWSEHDGELAMRFFGPRIGIAEDPATGSAAGALAALRVHDGAQPGEVVIRQGAEIGRPSEMRVSVGGAPGAPEPPRVGGGAVLVLEGTLHARLL